MTIEMIARPLTVSVFCEPGYELLVDGVSIGRLGRAQGCWFFNSDDKALARHIFFEVAQSRRSGWKSGRDDVLKSIRKAYECFEGGVVS